MELEERPKSLARIVACTVRSRSRCQITTGCHGPTLQVLPQSVSAWPSLPSGSGFAASWHSHQIEMPSTSTSGSYARSDCMVRRTVRSGHVSRSMFATCCSKARPLRRCIRPINAEPASVWQPLLSA